MTTCFQKRSYDLHEHGDNDLDGDQNGNLPETELPGGQDPNTVFKYGVLGNFEPEKPEVPSDQPGTIFFTK